MHRRLWFSYSIVSQFEVPMPMQHLFVVSANGSVKRGNCLARPHAGQCSAINALLLTLIMHRLSSI